MGHFIAKKDFYNIKKDSKITARWCDDTKAYAYIYPLPEFPTMRFEMECRNYPDLFDFVASPRSQTVAMFEVTKDRIISDIESEIQNHEILMRGIDSVVFKSYVETDISYLNHLKNEIKRMEVLE